MTPASRAKHLLIAFVAVLQLTGILAGSRGHWECTATGSANGRLNIPIQWTCDLDENCCLTGSKDADTGCCKDFIYEAVFDYRAGYQTCSPSGRRQYYCPSNRDCCVVAATSGSNQTGCCISKTAVDEASTGNGQFGEYDDTPKTPQAPSSYNSRTSTHSSGPSKVTIIVIVVLAVIIILSGLLGYGVNASRRRGSQGRTGQHTRQVAAHGLGRSSSGSQEQVAFLAPPSYWESPDGQDAVPENSAAGSPVPTIVSLNGAPSEQCCGGGMQQACVQLASRHTLPQYSPVPQGNETVVVIGDGDPPKDDESKCKSPEVVIEGL